MLFLHEIPYLLFIRGSRFPGPSISLTRAFPRVVWANILEQETVTLDFSLFVGRYTPNHARKLYGSCTKHQVFSAPILREPGLTGKNDFSPFNSVPFLRQHTPYLCLPQENPPPSPPCLAPDPLLMSPLPHEATSPRSSWRNAECDDRGRLGNLLSSLNQDDAQYSLL